MARERQQYSGDGGHQLLAIRCAFGEPRLGAAVPADLQRGHDAGGLFPRLLAGLRPAGPASCSGRSTAPTGGRCWTTASASISIAGTITWRRATWRPSTSPIRGCCGLPITSNRSAARTACCRSRTWAFRRSGSTTSPTSSSGTSSARSICTRRRCSNTPWRRWPGPAATSGGPTSSPAAAATFWRPTVRQFWSPQRGLFVNNLPWLAEEKTPAAVRPLAGHGHPVRPVPRRQHGRVAAGAGRMSARDGALLSVQRLLALLGLGAAGPGRRGGPRFPHALGNHEIGRLEQHAARGLGRRRRTRTDEWSHCCVSPIYVLFSDIAGIRPTAPGFARCQIRPQLGRPAGPGSDLPHGPRPDPFRCREAVRRDAGFP